MASIIKPIFWTDRAKNDLGKIMKFYTKLYGLKKAKKIANSIRLKTGILENPNTDFSKIGAVDNDFSHLKHNYRKLIDHHCKVTYREGKSKIYIVRVFDTRQLPSRNK